MRLPISYALSWPDRFEVPFGAMDFSQPLDLRFEPPDLDTATQHHHPLVGAAEHERQRTLRRILRLPSPMLAGGEPRLVPLGAAAEIDRLMAAWRREVTAPSVAGMRRDISDGSGSLRPWMLITYTASPLATGPTTSPGWPEIAARANAL